MFTAAIVLNYLSDGSTWFSSFYGKLLLAIPAASAMVNGQFLEIALQTREVFTQAQLFTRGLAIR